jgi:hypothetical protein
MYHWISFVLQAGQRNLAQPARLEQFGHFIGYHLRGVRMGGNHLKVSQAAK